MKQSARTVLAHVLCASLIMAAVCALAVLLLGCASFPMPVHRAIDAIDRITSGSSTSVSTNVTSVQDPVIASEPVIQFTPPTSIVVDWPAQRVRPVGLVGAPGLALVLGRLADGRWGIHDWPAWLPQEACWYFAMPFPPPGETVRFELHATLEASSQVIFKQDIR